MLHYLQSEDFLKMSIPVVDVRSEGEYAYGHIPGAANVPLFSNEERHIIGILYKQQGKKSAIEKGLEVVGPKMLHLLRTCQNLSGKSNCIALYCWRGGMRSNSFAWLLHTAGMQVYVLTGGYKAYRRQVLVSFEKPPLMYVLGGFTGSGKTAILQELSVRGAQVINLEKLANHKGSAFGSIGENPQPSQEMFENLLHAAISSIDTSRPVWIEDESRSIGQVSLPVVFYEHKRNSLTFFIERTSEERIACLLEEYGKVHASILEAAIHKIHKRLGNDVYKFTLQALHTGNLPEVCRRVLIYYDRAYARLIAQRNTELVKKVHICENENNAVIAQKLLSLSAHEICH